MTYSIEVLVIIVLNQTVLFFDDILAYMSLVVRSVFSIWSDV